MAPLLVIEVGVSGGSHDRNFVLHPRPELPLANSFLRPIDALGTAPGNLQAPPGKTSQPVTRDAGASDLGCGTGTLTILAKQSRPEANLTGLDIDPQVLQVVMKAEKAGFKIKWDIGLANALPYPNSSYDRVLTSLVFHHLTSDDKRRGFHEISRILRDGAELHFVDFGAPQSSLMQPIAALFSRLEEAADNFEGRLPGMMALAGFDVEETGRFLSVFGPLVMVRARKTGERKFLMATLGKA